MAWRGDFTSEEWATLLDVTTHLSAYMMTASPSGTIGNLKEAFAAGSMLIETKDDPDALPLLREIAAEVTADREEDETAAQSAEQPDRAARLELIRAAVAIIDAKAGADALTIKRWLNRMAVRIAEASSEGGFLGFGGKRVSEAERVALDELAAILGTAPAA